MRLGVLAVVVVACGCNQLFGIHDLNNHGDAHGAGDALAAGVWAQVATDSASTCAIRTDGSLWCWGAQPILSGTDETAPVRVGTASWAAVSGGGDLACGLQTDRSLWCWGAGALGNGMDGGESSTPLEIDPGPWVSVTVSNHDACAIRADQSLWCWGFSYLGSLGGLMSPQGPEGDVLTPTQVDNHAWLAVDVDGQTICGLQSDHTVWCAGDLRFAGIDTYPNGTFQMIAAGWTTLSMSFTGACGVTDDGHADCVLEQAPAPAHVDERTDWTAISVRGGICGLHRDGTLDCWNGVEGLATGSATAPTPVAGGAAAWTGFALAFDHLCGVGADANLWCVGNQANGELGNGVGPHLTPTQLPGTWATVHAGTETTCAVDLAGSASCWGAMIGDGTFDLHQTPTPVGSWSAFSAGFGDICGLRAGNELWCWGENFNGEVGNGTTNETLTPTLVTGGLAWSAVSVGFGGAGNEGSTCGVTTGGQAFCWGQNGSGQLGDGGTEMTSATPDSVELLANVSSLAVGGDFACAIAQGQMSCWGNDDYGQLDDGGGGSNAHTPKLVPGTFSQVVAGEDSACAIEGSGAATCWGDGAVPSGPVAATGPWLQLATTYDTVCGIQADQSLWCWGANGAGQIGDGTLSPRASPVRVGASQSWRSVSAGAFHTCAIDAAQELWCWGDNTEGQIGDGTAIATAFQLVPGS